jgi:glycosyltransferase involved in cell wall biosynthesis
MTADGPPILVSVVLPVRDAADVVGQQLEALAEQDGGLPWELVVVDDASTDATRAVVRRYADRLPALTLVARDRPGGSGAARNVGAGAARGRYLVFCDADDVVAPDWLEAHAEALGDHPLVTGPILTDRMNDVAAAAANPTRFGDRPPVGNGFLPYALGANLGVRREVFDELGGFDPRPNGNDKTFCWSAILAGHHLHFAPRAVVHYRLRRSTRGTFRRQYAIGRGAPTLYRRFRDHGMPRSSFGGLARDLVRAGAWLVRPWRPEARLGLARTAGRRLGRLVGSVRAGVLYL